MILAKAQEEIELDKKQKAELKAKVEKAKIERDRMLHEAKKAKE